MDLSPVRRTPEGAVVAGVCVGLARRWGVDPLLLRVAMVLLALLGGLGIAVYLGAVLLVPKEGDSDFPVRSILPFTRDWPAPAVIGAVVGGGALLMGLLSGVSPIGIGPAIGLGFLWYFGFFRSRRTTPQPPHVLIGGPTPAPSREPLTDFERAAAAWQARVAETRQPLAPTPGPPSTVDQAPIPLRPLYPIAAQALSDKADPLPQLPHQTRRAPTRARWIWPLTLALVGASLTMLGLLSAAGTSVPGLAYPAAALGCVGLSLVISTWFGRPRLLLFSGLLLAVATVVTAVSFVLPGPVVVGEERLTYTATTPLVGGHTVDLGELTVDLREAVVEQNTDVTYTVRVGELRVLLPKAGNVIVDVTINAGSLTAPDASGRKTSHDGLNQRHSYERILDPTAPVLRLHLRQGLGDVVVTP